MSAKHREALARGVAPEMIPQWILDELEREGESLSEAVFRRANRPAWALDALR